MSQPQRPAEEPSSYPPPKGPPGYGPDADLFAWPPGHPFSASPPPKPEPRSHRLIRHYVKWGLILVLAIVGGLVWLGLTQHSSPAPSTSSTAEQLYLADLDRGNVLIDKTSADRLVIGRKVCSDIAAGRTAISELENSGLTPYQSGYVFAAAGLAFCPDAIG